MNEYMNDKIWPKCKENVINVNFIIKCKDNINE